MFCGPLVKPRFYWGTMARPGRFELPTPGFEVRCSIQLSYGRSPRNLARSRPVGMLFGGAAYSSQSSGSYVIDIFHLFEAEYNPVKFLP